MMTEFKISKDDEESLEKFLDAIGIYNHCCGCPNDSYTIEKDFTVVIEGEPDDR